MYSRRVPEVDGQTHPPPSIKSTSAGERTQPPHSPKTHISQALCSDATTPAHIPRHAVNPSLGARVQHPCCTRSRNGCRALRCEELDYLEDKRDKNVVEDYTRGRIPTAARNVSSIGSLYARALAAHDCKTSSTYWGFSISSL